MDAGQRPPASYTDPRALILAFTLGVLVVHALAALPSLPWLAALALSALLVPWRGRAFLLMFALGVVLSSWRAQDLLDARWPASRHGEERIVTGHVDSLPERHHEPGRDGRPTNTWRFVFAPTSSGDSGLPGRIRVSWYRSGESVAGAECWRFRLRLRTPHGSLDPGSFDYEGWLFRQEIGALGSVKGAERCTEPGGSRLLAFRQQLVDRLRSWLPDHPALGLMAALAVGDTSAVSDADWDVFRMTGTTHLVAISGLNVAIVAAFGFFLFRGLWSLWPALCLRAPAQRIGALGATLLAVGYALLAGFEPPVVRAMLMLLFVAGAALLHRLNEPSRVLALAWLAILLLDPFAVLSPGLWLSFGAVAAIFYFSMNRLSPRGWVFSLVGLQLLLSVALMPLTLRFFHGVSASAPLINLLAVPLFSLLTPVLLGAVLLAGIFPLAGLPLLGVTAAIVQGLREALGWAADQSASSWIAAGPPDAALALALLGSALLFAPRGLPVKPLALLCFVPLFLPPRHAPAEGFELTALDVGQGLAVVVRTANHALLYDAGPAFEDGFDAGESVVAPFLLTQGLRRLDVLLLSHGDNDHAGGVPAVRRLLGVDREIGTQGGEPCVAGTRWDWDGVRFEILHPAQGGAWSDNNSSCVLRVSGPKTALLAGDIEKDAERALLREQSGALRADILIAPHHGSRTSSTPEFVAAVQPELVIYGAAWRSHFGHPRPEVVARYAALGARQYVTGNGGAIRVRVNPEKDLPVSEWRREAARFWNAPAEALPAEALLEGKRGPRLRGGDEAQSFVGFGASP